MKKAKIEERLKVYAVQSVLTTEDPVKLFDAMAAGKTGLLEDLEVSVWSPHEGDSEEDLTSMILEEFDCLKLLAEDIEEILFT